MNNQGRSIIDRRGILLLLAAVGGAAVLLWFSMIGGVRATSADGGLNSGSQVGQATQQYGDQPPINTCLLPIWIPCPDPRG